MMESEPVPIEDISDLSSYPSDWDVQRTDKRTESVCSLGQYYRPGPKVLLTSECMPRRPTWLSTRVSQTYTTACLGHSQWHKHDTHHNAHHFRRLLAMLLLSSQLSTLSYSTTATIMAQPLPLLVGMPPSWLTPWCPHSVPIGAAASSRRPHCQLS